MSQSSGPSVPTSMAEASELMELEQQASLAATDVAIPRDEMMVARSTTTNGAGATLAAQPIGRDLLFSMLPPEIRLIIFQAAYGYCQTVTLLSRYDYERRGKQYIDSDYGFPADEDDIGKPTRRPGFPASYLSPLFVSKQYLSEAQALWMQARTYVVRIGSLLGLRCGSVYAHNIESRQSEFLLCVRLMCSLAMSCKYVAVILGFKRLRELQLVIPAEAAMGVTGIPRCARCAQPKTLPVSGWYGSWLAYEGCGV